MIGVLWARLSVSPRSRSVIGISPKDPSGAGVGERGVNHGEPVKRLGSRDIGIVANAIVENQVSVVAIRVLRVEREILVANAAETAVVQRGGIGQPVERAGYRIAGESGRVAGAAGLHWIKIELSR